MATPTLTHRRGAVKWGPRHKFRQPREPQALVRARKKALAESGHTYERLAAAAGVTYSMALKWMGGRRKSATCERAFQTLTKGEA